VFKIPGMHYLGFGLNKDFSKQLSALVEKERLLLTESKKDHSDLQTKPNADLEKATKEKEQFIQYWSYLSLCAANSISLLQTCKSLLSKREWTSPTFAFWQPIDMKSTAVFDIKVERADKFCLNAGTTFIFLGGDAAASVDPVIGLGCNIAIFSSELYETALNEIDYLRATCSPQKNQRKELDKIDPEKFQKTILDSYQNSMSNLVTRSHKISIDARKLYRSDAVSVENFEKGEKND
jgi:hypothetical protein